MNREDIIKQRESILKKMEKLNDEYHLLLIADYLLCDKQQWYKESIENHPKKRGCAKNYLDGKLVGRIYWMQDFKDEYTGIVFPVERNRVVRVDGNWNFNKTLIS